MKKKLTTVMFQGTKDQEMQLIEVCKKYRDVQGNMMPVLQQAQEIYGYLPYQVQKIISDETGIPIEKIYGVATFYAQFSMSPNGKYVVSMCLGTACYVKGAGAILEEIEKVLKIEDGGCTPDGKFSLEVCRCVGACGLAPVMIVGGDVYGKMTPDRVAGILAKYE
jgi:NADP-reducing hydrogenase subunit HndA